MSKQYRILLASVGFIASLGIAYAGIPNSSHPTTFLGPTARLGYTSPLTVNTAYSLLGEAGAKNYRVGGTVAWRIDPDSRIKLSGEYLWQKITYSFFSGNTDQWVQQGALGLDYEYIFANLRLKPSASIDAWLSQARSKPLSNVAGTFVNSAGMTEGFTDIRRIAGSHARGIGPGVAISPWWGSRIGAELDYDQVRYDTQNTNDVTASGLGGTINISQALTDNISLNLSGSDIKIYNNYAASLNWSNLQFYGSWSFGVFGDYTKGKNQLPNTYDVGLSAEYYLENAVAAPVSLKGENLKGEVPAAAPADDFLAWTSNPAVYMPQVLAIADGRLVCAAGTGPMLISAIPDDTDTEVDTFNITSHFSGDNLTYSLVSTTPALSGDDTITVSPGGVVSFDVSTQYTVTVMAANACGSVKTSFVVGFVTELNHNVLGVTELNKPLS